MFKNAQTPPPPPPPPSAKSKSGLKAGNIIPAVIIVVCLVGALYFSGFFDDFTNDFSGGTGSDGSTNGILTPTRDIEGTWTTTFATQFTIATDFQNFGQLEDVGTEDRTMTWKITGTSDENIVIVYVSFSSSNTHLISGSGYTPDVSPMQLTGIINGTQLTLTRGNQGPIEQIGTVGVFTFTTDLMQGTWHDHWEGVYEQNVYTATNGLKLMKQ